jgi:hypothetical protein
MGQFKQLDIEIQELLAQDETPAAISALLDIPVSLVYDTIHLQELEELLAPVTIDLYSR